MRLPCRTSASPACHELLKVRAVGAEEGCGTDPPHLMSSRPVLPRTTRPRRVERTRAARMRRASSRRGRLQHAVMSAVGIVAAAATAGVAMIMLLAAAVVADGGTPTQRTGRPVVVAVGDTARQPVDAVEIGRAHV